MNHVRRQFLKGCWCAECRCQCRGPTLPPNSYPSGPPTRRNSPLRERARRRVPSHRCRDSAFEQRPRPGPSEPATSSTPALLPGRRCWQAGLPAWLWPTCRPQPGRWRSHTAACGPTRLSPPRSRPTPGLRTAAVTARAAQMAREPAGSKGSRPVAPTHAHSAYQRPRLRTASASGLTFSGPPTWAQVKPTHRATAARGASVSPWGTGRKPVLEHLHRF